MMKTEEPKQHTTMQVSECLTASHAECIGWYHDQTGEIFVRCLCKCHEEEDTTLEEQRKGLAPSQSSQPKTRKQTTTHQHQDHRASNGNEA